LHDDDCFNALTGKYIINYLFKEDMIDVNSKQSNSNIYENNYAWMI